ncbi:6-phospho-3-hexuloisomerase [Halobacillus sp. ACCC02827]|uniref:6-phospho-3-hexuloisomerase n=1 Tax=Halobacillus sp. ACCC02827 TaxID=3052090 RepID=UPI0025700616|nr:6-phospho-3-hexuloisomerase [Halobacillus sp. ACCC02827]WJE14192.1 6-phospho-3-hexuloisomerase [Halobacillus sp. ACCC02827]
MKEIIVEVAKEVTDVLRKINEDQALKLAAELGKANRIFVTGEGRSGLMGKAFAMRLMHGGFEVYVTGETITPTIEKGDLLIAITGSGTTSGLVQYMETAAGAGARTAVVTTNSDAPILDKCDTYVLVPAATKRRNAGEPETIQPLGNQFDQSVHLFLDAVVIQVVGGDQEEMAARHANLE